MLEELAGVNGRRNIFFQSMRGFRIISAYRQVGQTGKTVRPELYLACGISEPSSMQLVWKTLIFIVAINRDEDAPIFDIADLGIVGDLNAIVPKLTEAVKAVKAK